MADCEVEIRLLTKGLCLFLHVLMSLPHNNEAFFKWALDRIVPWTATAIHESVTIVINPRLIYGTRVIKVHSLFSLSRQINKSGFSLRLSFFWCSSLFFPVFVSNKDSCLLWTTETGPAVQLKLVR